MGSFARLRLKWPQIHCVRNCRLGKRESNSWVPYRTLTQRLTFLSKPKQQRTGLTAGVSTLSWLMRNGGILHLPGDLFLWLERRPCYFMTLEYWQMLAIRSIVNNFREFRARHGGFLSNLHNIWKTSLSGCCALQSSGGRCRSHLFVFWKMVWNSSTT